MSNGILLLSKDSVIETRAKRNKIDLRVGNEPGLPFDKTLITQPGTTIPWELIPAAWGLLDKWDAAVPLWRYDVTAESAGTVGEREETKLIIRDIRVLLHAYELLFVRKNEAGSALVETWLRECSSGGDKRLAFLRAVYHVKPRLCVLPTSWLNGVLGQSRRYTNGAVYKRGVIRPAPIVQRSANVNRPLVRVELSPGRFVKCHDGDQEKVAAQFKLQESGRGVNR